MKRCLVVVLCLLSALAFARGKKPKKPKAPRHDALGAITLNGEPVKVRWTDGDSFTVTDGLLKGTKTRLGGYNTLEAYGPVHVWGEWTAAELYEVAKSSSQVAASETWDCTTDSKRDGYGRLLVTCPQLTLEIIRRGHAHVYAVEGTKADAAALAAQREAMTERRGMWRKGTVHGLVTSLHSLDEPGGDGKVAYNRVVDTRTGAALKRKHTGTYETCQKVCETIDGQASCMVYVPFKQRYRSQPDCLK